MNALSLWASEKTKDYLPNYFIDTPRIVLKF